MLKATGLYVWYRIEISEERLSAWPVEGDLLDMDLDITVIEVDEEGNELMQEEEGSSDLSNIVTTNHEGLDAGPAPLQIWKFQKKHSKD